ncbi:MAG: hypothetical protein ACK559_05880, partial [bacterium]
AGSGRADEGAGRGQRGGVGREALAPGLAGGGARGLEAEALVEARHLRVLAGGQVVADEAARALGAGEGEQVGEGEVLGRAGDDAAAHQPGVDAEVVSVGHREDHADEAV